jgi:PKD repeat protein
MKSFLFISLSILTFGLTAQNEPNNWYFGDHTGLTFNSGTGTAVTQSSINILEGSGSISDKNGDLLFYTDGMTVWNKNHQQMPNGYGLAGAPSSGQSGLVLPKPGNTDIYYIFTVDENAGSRGLRYSVVDMSLGNGLGDVTEKNTLLFTPSSEKMAAVHHANGIDIWLVTHKWESDEFVSYLVTETGILTNSPIVSKTGTIHEGHVSRSRGYMKLSPQGDKLALAIETMNRFELYNFDNLTGKVSNPIIFPDNYLTAYGVEFSSDGRYLYGSERWGKKVYQFNVSSGNLSEILASQTIIKNYRTKGLQMAPDGRIYISKESFALDVINYPNESGINCSYESNAINLQRNSGEGLPGFNASWFNNINFTWNDHCPGTETSFNLINPNGVLDVFWFFEYPSTASENTSTDFNPVHIYDIGTYEVRLIANYTDKSDTIIKVIEIGAPGVINLGEDRELCAGENLCANSGFTNLVWSTGNIGCRCIEPKISGTYWVKGTDKQGCKEISDTVFLTINPLPVIEYSVTNVTDLNASDGSIDITVSNGTPPYSFLWSNEETIEDIDSINEGWYIVSVTDENSCKKREGISVGGPFDCEGDTLDWIGLQYSTGGSAQMNCIRSDSYGNIYATGIFSGTINYKGHILTSAGYYDTFIAKYSNDGDLLWIKSYGGTLSEVTWKMEIDTNENIFILGDFVGTIYFEDLELTALERQDIFIVKLNSSGIPQWAKSAGTTNDDYATNIGVDKSGECFITGYYNGTMFFDDQSITSVNEQDDIYLAKYDTSGVLKWLKSYGTTSRELGINLTSDENNNIFLTGWAWGMINFGGVITECDGGYFLKMDQDGNTLYAISLPPFCNDIEVKNGNIYIYGDFSGTETFGDSTLTSSGGNDKFIVKFAGQEFQWVKQIKNTTLRWGSEMCVDASENIYISGSFLTDVIFDEEILTKETHPDNPSNSNEFIAKYDAQGNFVWCDKITTKSAKNTFAYIFGITVNSLGRFFASGSYSYSPEFGNLTTPENERGFFIAEYGSSKFNSDFTVLYPECGANGATIDLSVDGGQIPYAYLWSNDEIAEDISGLTEGTYSVAVTDAHHCVVSDTIHVDTYQALSVSSIIKNVSIAGFNDGEIDITVSGGTAPYSFSWSTGSTMEDLTNLSPGVYTVEIVDFKGSCTITSSFSVSEPDTPIQADFNVIFNCTSGIACIDLTISGGTGPYSVLWSTGETSEDICGLSEGIYSVIIADAEFMIKDSIFVELENAIQTSIKANNTCYGSNTGSAFLEISGGTLPYTILWSTGSLNDTINNLVSGRYHVTVSDAGNCIQTDSVDIMEDHIPTISQAPVGIENFCDLHLYQNTYSTPLIDADLYMWSFEPATAGTISGNDVIANVDWNNDFFGTAEVRVKAENHCGIGQFSPPLYISVGETPDKPTTPIGLSEICNNSLSDYSTQEIYGVQDYDWILLPAYAGSIIENQNNITINWSDSYSGIAKLIVKAINDCGTSDYSDTLFVEVHQSPTSNMEGNASICAGETTNITINLSGTAPWEITYTDGILPVSVTTFDNPFIFSVAETGIYEVTALSDLNCTGIDFGEHVSIFVNDLPTAIIEGDTSICDGNSTNITVYLTGTAPWEITFTDGNTPFTIITHDNPYIFEVYESGNYEIIELNDTNCYGSEISGHAIVNVMPVQTALFNYTTENLEVSFNNLSQNANTFLWNFGDNQTSTDENPVHTYSDAGSYNVILTATNEYCGDSTYMETIIVNNLGIEQNNLLNTVNFYPNPTDGYLYFEINNGTNEILSVEIFDITGNKIYIGIFKYGVSKGIINLSDYAKGLYTIRLIRENKSVYQKLIITD